MMMMMTIMMMMIMMMKMIIAVFVFLAITPPKIVNFQASLSRFSMEVDLDNIYR